MSRRSLSCLIAAVIFAPAVHADVKKTEKTQVKFEGMLGRMMGMAGGAAAKDGVTNSVAVKGHRMATVNDQNGQIIDLSEEKIYSIDFKKKEYRVVTFAQMREQMQKARAEMEKNMKDMPPEARGDMGQQPAANLEVTFDVKAGGETRTIAGHPAKLMVLTVTAKEKGKALEESGGMVMTNEVWLGPRIAALDEVGQFYMKFATAVYGDSAALGEQFASLSAMYPSMQHAMKTMGEQLRKLDGTPLMSVQRTETVKSAAAMAQASSAPASGGGLSGALARRMMGNKGKPEQRSLLYTSTSETVSIAPAAADADVAIPAGFKEKK